MEIMGILRNLIPKRSVWCVYDSGGFYFFDEYNDYFEEYYKVLFKTRSKKKAIGVTNYMNQATENINLENALKNWKRWYH